MGMWLDLKDTSRGKCRFRRLLRLERVKFIRRKCRSNWWPALGWNHDVRCASSFALIGGDLVLTHTHTRLAALFPALPRWTDTRKVSQSGFYWSKRQWVAVASASLHLAPDRQPRQHHIHHSVFLQAGCPSCRPTNSVKALNGKLKI